MSVLLALSAPLSVMALTLLLAGAILVAAKRDSEQRHLDPGEGPAYRGAV